MGQAKKIAEYGSWWSSIDTDVVNSGNCRSIDELQCDGNSVFWLESQFPSGRRVLLQAKKDGSEIIEWTQSDITIRNTVHEYGGGSFIIVNSIPYFTTPCGIFRQLTAASEPELIVAGDRSHRFADLCYFKGILYAIYEVHSGNKVENMIVKILEGDIQPVVTGADFYASPRLSPNGQYFCWMEWNIPNMPWDETAIVVSLLEENGDIKTKICRIDRSGVNYQSPEWSPSNDLYLISDHTNWWNVYKVNLTEGELDQNVFPVNTEIGTPLWQFADRQFAVNKQGVLLNVAGKIIFKPWNAKAQLVIGSPYSYFKNLALDENHTAYAIASGPAKSSTIVRIQLDTNQVDVIRESRPSLDIDKYDISVPESINFKSDGVAVQAWFYPPFSTSYQAPENTLPPVVLFAHGGPTSYSPNTLNMKIQYLTTRGFAVCDVNYRGSTGFGTVFRNMLRRNWGIVDRNDMINAAKKLISQRRVNPRHICIVGSSAGGYLLLATIIKSNLFAAAASLYGVSDLIGLAKDTHKFELGYNEQLVGKFPEESALYEERSPLNHCDQLTTPVAFFHGEDDLVVPLTQSVQLHEMLKAKGVTTSLSVFPGEAHGFKGSFANKIALSGFYYFFCRVLGIRPSVESEIKIENLPRLQVRKD
ncbi:unnamed protein product [Thelazia callipaeda]|uniref:Acyl-peptide hydrolase n=1 Tax=Thelazia callipaeda TaxID=103827 RepID=A0A158RB09_THECL|nr:unnamed protein product [Thelazia callipaeda]